MNYISLDLPSEGNGEVLSDLAPFMANSHYPGGKTVLLVDLSRPFAASAIGSISEEIICDASIYVFSNNAKGRPPFSFCFIADGGYVTANDRKVYGFSRNEETRMVVERIGRDLMHLFEYKKVSAAELFSIMKELS